MTPMAFVWRIRLTHQQHPQPPSQRACQQLTSRWSRSPQRRFRQPRHPPCRRPAHVRPDMCLTVRESADEMFPQLRVVRSENRPVTPAPPARSSRFRRCGSASSDLLKRVSLVRPASVLTRISPSGAQVQRRFRCVRRRRTSSLTTSAFKRSCTRKVSHPGHVRRAQRANQPRHLPGAANRRQHSARSKSAVCSSLRFNPGPAHLR